MRKVVLIYAALLPNLAFAQSAQTPAQGVLGFLIGNSTLILGVLWGLAETLALIPSIQSNSVFTLIYNTLKSLHETIFKSTPQPPKQ